MSPSRSHRERGVTAVVVAIVIGVLCAFVALVINSGHIMSVRGQLQNATDAAALAGVRRLDGTAAGFTNARAAAKAYAALHITDNGQNVTINDSDVAIGSWNFAAPRDSAFTEITGTTAADLANAIAVRVDAGRDASHAAAGGPVPVTMGGLEYVGKDTTNVSAQSVAVRGGPKKPDCAVLPLTFSSCAIYNDDGTLKCASTLTFNRDGGDNMGFTSLTSESGVTPPVMKQILNCKCPAAPVGTCPPIVAGETIWVQNGADLAPVASDFRKRVNEPVLAPVVDMPGCKFVSAGVGATVLGFVTVTITKVNPPPLNSIELKIDCEPKPVDTPGGGGNFGTPAMPQLVR